MNDHEVAATIAREAGELLVQIRAEGGDDLKARGDLGANELILRRLAELVPDDGVLSEESADDKTRLDKDRVWIVDPLDGTREFSEPPRHDWAVHVALAVREQVTTGAVAVPGRDLVLSTGAPPTLPPPIDGPVRLAVSRTRPPACTEQLVAALGAELVELGSAGYKAMAVILGEVDVYAHSGGQYEWDSAAPVAVAAASGCHVSRLDGSPLRYNQADPYLPDLLICRPERADEVLAALR